jgi:hypothetical protein
LGAGAGGDGSASDSSGGELDLEVANISRAAHTREQQASRKQEQHAEWERRLKQDDDAARARTTRDMEERLRRWREECEESEKRQKRMLEEASEVVPVYPHRARYALLAPTWGAQLSCP